MANRNEIRLPIFNHIPRSRIHNGYERCCCCVVLIRTSFSETRRPIATKFWMVIESCCSFDPPTSDFAMPLKISRTKNWPKFGVFFDPPPILRCAPVVLSADKLFARPYQTSSCQSTMFSLPRNVYRCNVIWAIASDSFYHAMHFSAKRSLAIACRPSVRPSVCLWRWWFVITYVGNLGN